MCPSPASRPRRRIEADPARAGQIDLAPGVQVGEILVRAARAVERFHVGLELDQVAADEARREPEMAQQLAEQPRRIAARTAAVRQRLLRRLHAGFHADEILDVLREPLVDADEEIDRARARVFVGSVGSCPASGKCPCACVSIATSECGAAARERADGRRATAGAPCRDTRRTPASAAPSFETAPARAPAPDRNRNGKRSACRLEEEVERIVTPPSPRPDRPRPELPGLLRERRAARGSSTAGPAAS